MASVERLPQTPAETTDLERRVLAHERVLRALIACMARREPRFLDHFDDPFVEPMAKHEHDHRGTEARCDAVVVPAKAFREPDSHGPGRRCERGHAPLTGACVAIDLPDNAHLDRSGNRWRCDRGFELSGGACVLGR